MCLGWFPGCGGWLGRAGDSIYDARFAPWGRLDQAVGRAVPRTRSGLIWARAEFPGEFSFGKCDLGTTEGRRSAMTALSLDPPIDFDGRARGPGRHITLTLYLYNFLPPVGLRR